MVFRWSTEASLDEEVIAPLARNAHSSAASNAALSYDGNSFHDEDSDNLLDKHGCNKVSSSKELLESRRFVLTLLLKEADHFDATAAASSRDSDTGTGKLRKRDYHHVFTRLSQRVLEKVDLSCQSEPLNPNRPSHCDVLFVSFAVLGHVNLVSQSSREGANSGAAGQSRPAKSGAAGQNRLFQSVLKPAARELVDARVSCKDYVLKEWSRLLEDKQLTRAAVKYTMRVAEFMIPQYAWTLGQIPDPKRYWLNFSVEDIKLLFYGALPNSDDPNKPEAVMSAMLEELRGRANEPQRPDSNITKRLPTDTSPPMHRPFAHRVHEMLRALVDADTKLEELLAQHHATVKRIIDFTTEIPHWNLYERLVELKHALDQFKRPGYPKPWRLCAGPTDKEPLRDQVRKLAEDHPAKFIELAHAVYVDREDADMIHCVHKLVENTQITEQDSFSENASSVHAVVGGCKRRGVLLYDLMLDDVESSLYSLRDELRRCYASAALNRCWPGSAEKEVRKIFIPFVSRNGEGEAFEQMLHVAAHPPGAETLVDIGLRLDGLYEVVEVSGVQSDASGNGEPSKRLRWERSTAHHDAKQRFKDLKTLLLEEIRDDNTSSQLQLEGHYYDHRQLLRHIQIRFRAASKSTTEEEALKPVFVRIDNAMTVVNASVVQATDAQLSAKGGGARMKPYLRLVLYRTERHVDWKLEHNNEVSEPAAILAEVLDLEQQLAERAKSVDVAAGGEHADIAEGQGIERTAAYRISPATRKALPCIDHAVRSFWKRQAAGDSPNAELLQLLSQDKALLFITAAELDEVKHTLIKMQYFVETMHIDAQSCDAKTHRLRGLSRQPAIQFVHLIIDGHLDRRSAESILALVQRSPLKLLVIVGLESQVFPITEACVTATEAAKATVIGTNTCTHVGGVGSMIEATSKSLPAIIRDARGQEFIDATTQRALEEATVRANALQQLQTTALTRPSNVYLVSTKMAQLSAQKIMDALPQLECHKLTEDSVAQVVSHIASHTPQSKPKVLIVDTVQLEYLAVVATSARTVFPEVVKVEVLPSRAEDLLQSIAAEASSDDQANALKQSMQTSGTVHELLFSALCRAGLDTLPSFSCFVQVTPLCEFLDQRMRISLYLRCFLQDRLAEAEHEAIVAAADNVHCESLWASLPVSGRVEASARYVTSRTGSTVRADDVFRSAVQRYQELDWNSLQMQWRTSGYEYSDMHLVRTLRAYHQPIKLLSAMGPGLFFNMESTPLSGRDNRPLPWVAALAARLLDPGCLAAITRAADEASTRDAVSFMGALKWILVSGGVNVDLTEHDVVSIDKAGIVMDIAAVTARMDDVRRLKLLRTIAAVGGRPTLYAKQSRLRDFFCATPVASGPSRTARPDEIEALQELGHGEGKKGIGSAFLGVLVESSMTSVGTLRSLWPGANALWMWFNNPSDKAFSQTDSANRDLMAMVATFSPEAAANAVAMSANRGESIEAFAGALFQYPDLAFKTFSALQSLIDVSVIDRTKESKVGSSSARLGCTRLLCCVRRHSMDDFVATDVLPVEKRLLEEQSALDLFDAYRARQAVTPIHAQVNDALLTAFLNVVTNDTVDEVSLHDVICFFDASLTPAARTALLIFADRQLTNAINAQNRNERRVECLRFVAVAVWFLQPLAPITPLEPAHEKLVRAAANAIAVKDEAAKRFVAQVAAEPGTAPPIAACLAGYEELVSQSIFEMVATARGDDDRAATSVMLTNMKLCTKPYPPYYILYPRHRALPKDRIAELTEKKYDVQRGYRQYLVSQGISRDLILTNLTALANIETELGDNSDTHFGRLLIMLWFRCAGIDVSTLHQLTDNARMANAISSGINATVEVARSSMDSLFTEPMVKPVPMYIDVRYVSQTPFRILFRTTTEEDKAFTAQVLSTGYLALPPFDREPARPDLQQMDGLHVRLAEATGRRLAYRVRQVMTATQWAAGAQKNAQYQVAVQAALGPALAIFPTSEPIARPQDGAKSSEELKRIALEYVASLAASAVDFALDMRVDGREVASIVVSTLVMAIGFLTVYADSWRMKVLEQAVYRDVPLLHRVWEEAGYFLSNSNPHHDAYLRGNVLRAAEDDGDTSTAQVYGVPALAKDFLDRLVDVTTSELRLDIGHPSGDQTGEGQQDDAPGSPTLQKAAAAAAGAQDDADADIAGSSAAMEPLFALAPSVKDATTGNGDTGNSADAATDDSGQPRLGVAAAESSPLAGAVAIDVSQLIEIDYGRMNTQTRRFYAPVSVTRGYDVFLVREKTKTSTLRFASVADNRDIVAAFPDHGAAWNWALSLRYPAALVAGSFAFSKQPSGAGWNGYFGSFPRPSTARDEAQSRKRQASSASFIGSPTSPSLAGSNSNVAGDESGSTTQQLVPRAWHVLAFADVLCIKVSLAVRHYGVLACRCILAAVEKIGALHHRKPVVFSCNQIPGDCIKHNVLYSCPAGDGSDAGVDVDGNEQCYIAGQHSLYAICKHKNIQPGAVFRVIVPQQTVTEETAQDAPGLKFDVEPVTLPGQQPTPLDLSTDENKATFDVECELAQERLNDEKLREDSKLPEIETPSKEIKDHLTDVDKLTDVQVVQLLCVYGEDPTVRAIAEVVFRFFELVVQQVHAQHRVLPDRETYTVYRAEDDGVDAMRLNDTGDGDDDSFDEQTLNLVQNDRSRLAGFAFVSIARFNLRQRMNDCIRNLIYHGAQDDVSAFFSVSDLKQLGSSLLSTANPAHEILQQFTQWIQQSTEAQCRDKLLSERLNAAAVIVEQERSGGEAPLFDRLPAEFKQWGTQKLHEMMAEMKERKLEAKAADATLALGQGCQGPAIDDVLFCVAPALFEPPLQLVFVRRPDAFDPVTGQTVGFIVDRRPLRADDVPDDKKRKALQQRKSWLVNVLRAPLSEPWKRWLSHHAYLDSHGFPPVEHVSIVAKALADHHEDPKIRGVLVANLLHDVKHCKRKNRMYGVMACKEPNLDEWNRLSVKYAQIDLSDSREPIERQYRQLIGKFGPATTHVIVKGLDTIPDLMLKWCCEYTVRYPWRFILLVGCLTVNNLPENRDRLQNYMAITNDEIIRTRVSITFKNKDDGSFSAILDSANATRLDAGNESDKVFEWTSIVSTFVSHFEGRQRVLHLVSAPGAGKSYLMDQLRAKADEKKEVSFFFFDCSDDRLVEEALVSLVEDALRGGRRDQRCILIADEYHMLAVRKKVELLAWVASRLDNMKVVMIANRKEDHDDDVLEQLEDRVPGCIWTNEASGKPSLEARISTSKLYEALGNVALPADPVRKRDVVCMIVTLYPLLRGLLSDSAVSLRLLEKFDAPTQYKRGYWVNPLTRLLNDKLLRHGRTFPGLLVNSFKTRWESIYNEDFNTQRANMLKALQQVTRGECMPVDTLVTVAMAPAVLLYHHDVNRPVGVANENVEVFDKLLTFKELMARVSNSFHLHPIVRLAMWVEHTLAALHTHDSGVPAPNDEMMGHILVTLRRLTLVDQTDFPIILDERSAGAPIGTVDSVYESGNDLTDLDWIYDCVKRGKAVNWADIKEVWATTPVTNGAKLQAIMNEVAPSVVFDALTRRNVMQLLRKSNDIRAFVLSDYPVDRIAEESSEFMCPYFFALWSSVVAQSDLPRWQASPHELVRKELMTERMRQLPRLMEDDTDVGDDLDRILRFLKWVAAYGALVTNVENRPRHRSLCVRRMLQLFSAVTRIPEATEARQHVLELLGSRYFAPIVEPVDLVRWSDDAIGSSDVDDDQRRGEVWLHHLFAMAKERSLANDAWPPNMMLVHKAAQASVTVDQPMTPADAAALAVALDKERPSKDEESLLDAAESSMIAAIVQCREAGYLPPDVQNIILRCRAKLNDEDVTREQDVFRNLRTALSTTSVPVNLGGSFGKKLRDLRELVVRAQKI